MDKFYELEQRVLNLENELLAIKQNHLPFKNPVKPTYEQIPFWYHPEFKLPEPRS